MLKPLIRKTVRHLRIYLAEAVQDLGPKNHEWAYPQLNSIFYALMKQAKGQLRPSYTWGVLQAAHLAKSIGIDRISLVEFGVAGGNGLIALETASQMIEQQFPVGLDVYGFDTGRGLPPPTDWRDLPNIFSQGGYSMDAANLQAKLTRASLILGLIEETLPQFIASKPAPVAFISFDLDLYSSTVQSFQLLKAPAGLLMPRIHCHFDDILGFTFGDHNGERLAIAEFNASNHRRKISPIYGLKYFVPRTYFNACWVEQAYMAHILDHPLYNKPDGLVRCDSLDLRV